MPADRSAPGVRLTLFKDEKATAGEPVYVQDAQRRRLPYRSKAERSGPP